MEINQFKELEQSVIDSMRFTKKEVLTAEETARYMGISKSYLYKLTMRGEIPHYKPTGKMCYFNRAEVEAWLQQNRCATSTEITDKANRIMMGCNRQNNDDIVDKKRFENLQEFNSKLISENKHLQNRIDQLEKESERLRDENKKLKDMNDNLMSAWSRVQNALNGIINQ